MVNGLLSELEDHNCWTLAEAAGHASPYRMQHLLSRARVDERQLLDAAADWAAAHLTAGQDEDDVVLIVDETADEKSSADCAGAARQYSGTVGGIAMCQVTVTLTCASPAGHTLIGRALYLPADWAADEERRELAGVPDEIMFATKPQLADDLLQHAHDRGIRAGFTVGDEVYGGLDLRKSIRERGTGYVMAVRSNYMVTLPSGLRRTVKTAASLVKPGMWQRMRTGSATKGAKDYHWAMLYYPTAVGLLLAGVVSAAQIACKRARWSASARAWWRVWVAECCWPSRSSTPPSTASAVPPAAAGAAGPPGVAARRS